MELEVGEYVRNRYGEIGIVTKTYPRLMWRKKKNPSLLEYNEIKSHSKNIIDLIEDEDIGIMSYNGIVFKKFITQDDIIELKFGNYKLLKIATKEQFSNIEYKVEE